MGTWLSDYNNLVLEMTRDSEVARIVRLGLTDFEVLDANDQMRCHAWLITHLLSAQNLYFQAEDDTMHQAFAEQVLGFTASMLKTKGGLQWWTTARPIWRPEFVTHMDGLMQGAQPVTDTWPFFNDAN